MNIKTIFKITTSLSLMLILTSSYAVAKSKKVGLPADQKLEKQNDGAQPTLIETEQCRRVKLFDVRKDGELNVGDLIPIRQALELGKVDQILYIMSTHTAESIALFDLNEDGFINKSDLDIFRNYILGKICTNNSSNDPSQKNY